jgi:hypothetical protein
VDLGLVRHQLGECPAEADRLGREVAPAAVPLVEDQVDDRKHGRQPVGQQVRRGHAERDPGCLDLPLCADEALRHRLVRDEEGARDLLGGEAAQSPQGERDLGVERQGRMAAGEDELEPLVGDRRLVHLVLRRLRRVEEARLRGERPLAADAVDRPMSCRRHEPGARARGNAVAGPALGRDRERLLGGFLGEVEVAEEADQGREDASPLLAECLLEHYSASGRTSIAPPIEAAGMREASSMAASRSSASRKR